MRIVSSNAENLTEELVGSVRAMVDDTLRAFIAGKTQEADLADVADLAAVLAEFAQAGGKRMRAAFAYWGWRGAGGSMLPEHGVLSAATALELNHSAFLIHDDIVDGSDTRRGRPSMHAALAAGHRHTTWPGGPAIFGEALGLLLGDLCFAWADELISRSASGDRQAVVRRLYDQMVTDTVYGQLLDVQTQERRDYRPDRCLKVVRYKAARYMLTPPLQIGAAVAGADRWIQAAYGRFGTLLGEAYQLRDDLLGMFGDPRVTGKSNLDDLREGKATVLFATALRNADPVQREQLTDLYGRPDADEPVAEDLRVLLTKTGAVATVESMIAARRAAALEALEAAPIDTQAKDALGQLAELAINRTN
jgi:geranylgeranyl diphosphate synthase type I